MDDKELEMLAQYELECDSGQCYELPEPSKSLREVQLSKLNECLASMSDNLNKAAKSLRNANANYKEAANKLLKL